jgi:hypothetical protein|tara:strand:+ start:33584 stop:33715 length:132 start_codon:yes stop_codon:yes gene_type:complete
LKAKKPAFLETGFLLGFGKIGSSKYLLIKKINNSIAFLTRNMQ